MAVKGCLPGNGTQTGVFEGDHPLSSAHREWVGRAIPQHIERRDRLNESVEPGGVPSRCTRHGRMGRRR
jgi:hypothetical protein